jgi:hypothetical protein
MKRIGTFKFVQFALVSALAICSLTGTASAQVLAYKFSLPYAAHWGLATLPAGNYALAVEGIGTSARLRISRGSETVAYIAGQNFDNKESDRCRVTVVRSDAGNFVRDVTIPGIGEVFHFKVKTRGTPTEEQLAQAPAASGTK